VLFGGHVPLEEMAEVLRCAGYDVSGPVWLVAKRFFIQKRVIRSPNSEFALSFNVISPVDVAIGWFQLCLFKETKQLFWKNLLMQLLQLSA